MRAAILLVFLAATSAATAETLRLPPAEPPAQAGKTLPLKGATGAAKAGSCAAYGRGFTWAEATGTCVKIGGTVSVDGAVRR
jgi:hypothetical protein